MEEIHIITWKEDKWFIAKALEVEVASQGRTEKEAIKNLKEALELYFEDQNPTDVISLIEPKLQSLTIHINA